MAFKENIKRGQAFRVLKDKDPVTGINIYDRVSFKTLASDVYFDNGKSITSVFNYAEGFLAQGQTSITIQGANLTEKGLIDIYVPTEYMHMYPDVVRQYNGSIYLEFSSERNEEYVNRPGGVTIKVVCNDMSPAVERDEDEYPIYNPYHIVNCYDDGETAVSDIVLDKNVTYYLEKDFIVICYATVPAINSGTHKLRIESRTSYGYMNCPMVLWSDEAGTSIPYTQEIMIGDKLYFQFKRIGADAQVTACITRITKVPVDSGDEQDNPDGPDPNDPTWNDEPVEIDEPDGPTIPDEPIEYVYGWSNNESTDAQVLAMIEANDLGVIDLTEYWSVGQERTVTLSAMSASVSGLTDTHVSQTVTLVIVATKNDSGYPCNNYKIAFSVSGFSSNTIYTEPTFIIQQKNCLKEGGAMNASDTTNGSWNSCLRRSWCNSVYKNAFPSSLLPAIKPIYVQTIDGYRGHEIQESTGDYFFFPTEKEVFGTNTQTQQEEAELFVQWKYYSLSSSNRIKDINGVANEWNFWWLRSPSNYGYSAFCAVRNNGTMANQLASATTYDGIAPCFCI